MELTKETRDRIFAAADELLRVGRDSCKKPQKRT